MFVVVITTFGVVGIVHSRVELVAFGVLGSCLRVRDCRELTPFEGGGGSFGVAERGWSPHGVWAHRVWVSLM